MKKNNLVLGVLLLAIGGIALLNNMGITDFNISIWRLWPLFMIIPGLAFELSYFNNNGPVGLLVPGGILLTQGALFMFCSFFGYGHLAYLWPVFVGSVGIGLFQLYYFGNRERPLFYVSGAFIAFSVLSIFLSLISLEGNYVLPIILIAVGGMLLFNPKNTNNKPIITVEYENDEEKEDVK